MAKTVVQFKVALISGGPNVVGRKRTLYSVVKYKVSYG